MKRNPAKFRRTLSWSIVIFIGLSSAAAIGAGRMGRSAATNITINNNTSNLDIRHVYLSHTDQDDWTGDQLSESHIAPGESTTLNNVSCDQAEIKVIGEDQNGCFLYQIVACGSTATWTIANGAATDCGR